jgi:hypothetical protein
VARFVLRARLQHGADALAPSLLCVSRVQGFDNSAPVSALVPVRAQLAPADTLAPLLRQLLRLLVLDGAGSARAEPAGGRHLVRAGRRLR